MRKGSVSAVAAIALLLPLAGTTAQPPATDTAANAVPADFLEYLATLEGEDDDWTDFEGSDPAPAAKSPNTAAEGAAKVEKPK